MTVPIDEVAGDSSAGGKTRRSTLRLLTSALGTVAVAGAVTDGEARKKRKKPVRCTALPAQASCSTSAECCPGSTNRVCAQNYCGETLDPVCCGGIDAPCEVHCGCCGDLVCGIHGRCVY
jgi:hypothetical protein